jgi:hypothetical protein
VRQATTVGTIEIAAGPNTLYGLLTDLSCWRLFATEIRVPARALPHRLVPGVTFRAWHRDGLWWWRGTSTVLEAVPSRRLVLRVFSLGRPVATWRYDLTPTARGSRVTASTRDLRGRTRRLVCAVATGVLDRAAHRRRTVDGLLAGLKAAAENPVRPAGGQHPHSEMHSAR